MSETTTRTMPKPPSLAHSASVKYRKTVASARAIDVAMSLDVRDLTVPGGPLGQTWLRILRPVGATEPLPVVMYVHGDDPVLGNARTRRLVSKLALDVQAAVVIVDYSLSPKARYPIAVEETYAAAAWIAEYGNELGLDGSRIAIAADSAGDDIAAELMVLADKRGGPTVAAHVPTAAPATAVLRAALAA
jgi:acetyl esterase